MLSQGYTTDEALFGVDADDSYELGRYTRIELHRTLIPDIYKWKGECARIEASRRKNKEKNHLYEMTNEDFYIYMIIHLAKHMHLAGCGIKAILDIWIFLERYKDELDEDFIKQSLMNCGLDRFEKNVRKLAYVWFEHETCDDDIIRELSVHIAAGGWMGKDEFRNAKYLAGNYSNKEGKKVNKLKYYISCVFLKFDRMKKKYPVIEKHKYLLPVFWLVRLFSILLFKHNKIDEISENLDKSEEEIELGKKMLEFDKKIGL